MATIRKHGNGWQAQIRKKGHQPISKTFRNKSNATTWAKTIESEQERGIYISRFIADKTIMNEILDRYAEEIATTSKRVNKVHSCMKHLYKHFGSLAISSITSVELATYRDMRLKLVSSQTVRQELGLMNCVLKRAHQEWGIVLPYGVPSVRKPKIPQGRERRLEGNEEIRLSCALKNTSNVKAIFLFAIETAMRRGEICAMQWKHLNKKKQILFIPITKTEISRTIPLSNNAIQILNSLPQRIDGYVYGIKPDSVTRAFTRACKRENIEDLRFHDLRHEATSRLFEKGLNIMEVSSITGHKDLKMLKRYTHLRPEDLVCKLDESII